MNLFQTLVVHCTELKSERVAIGTLASWPLKQPIVSMANALYSYSFLYLSSIISPSFLLNYSTF